MAAALESAGHQADIVPFATEYEIPDVVRQILQDQPDITGLSMVFTGRGREFCRLAQALRAAGYRGLLVGGGPFASFNCERLLQDYPAFDASLWEKVKN
jgi:methylmalonyl-CoA mutase cobalamin-binding subunit